MRTGPRRGPVACHVHSARPAWDVLARGTSRHVLSEARGAPVSAVTPAHFHVSLTRFGNTYAGAFCDTPAPPSAILCGFQRIAERSVRTSCDTQSAIVSHIEGIERRLQREFSRTFNELA